MQILLSVVAITSCAVISDLILDKNGSECARFAKLAVTLTVLCGVFLPMIGRGDLSGIIPYDLDTSFDLSRYSGSGEYAGALEKLEELAESARYGLSDETSMTECECERLLYEKIKAETGIIPKEVDIELYRNGEEGTLSVSSVRVTLGKEDAAFSESIRELAAAATGTPAELCIG